MKYEILYKALTVKGKETTVEIFKVKKVGTKRTFFRATYKGKNISNTLWARRADSEKLAKNFIKHVESKAAV